MCPGPMKSPYHPGHPVTKIQGGGGAGRPRFVPPRHTHSPSSPSPSLAHTPSLAPTPYLSPTHAHRYVDNEQSKSAVDAKMEMSQALPERLKVRAYGNAGTWGSCLGRRACGAMPVQESRSTAVGHPYGWRRN